MQRGVYGVAKRKCKNSCTELRSSAFRVTQMILVCGEIHEEKEEYVY